jgi:hypothetical protein
LHGVEGPRGRRKPAVINDSKERGELAEIHHK